MHKLDLAKILIQVLLQDLEFRQNFFGLAHYVCHDNLGRKSRRKLKC